MLEFVIFIFPSFFTYMALIHGQKRKQFNIANQWLFLPILILYSFLSYFIAYLLFFMDWVKYLEGYLINIEIFNHIPEIKITLFEESKSIHIIRIAFVCFISYIMGWILRFFSFLELFNRIDQKSETYKLLKQFSNEDLIILFFTNGNIFVGQAKSYDMRQTDVQSLTMHVLMSGYKNPKELEFPNYTRISTSQTPTIMRTFYLNNVESIGKFDLQVFEHFLEKKHKNQSTKMTKCEKNLYKNLNNHYHKIQDSKNNYLRK